ncbi:DUF6380 family protein [Streptomyces sp. NPDC026672]
MDTLGRGDSTGEQRIATLRRAVASQTATACRAPFHRRGRRAGEGAR